MLRRLALSSAVGALLAGTYGILHDQVTYSLSPEYFTHFKFLQFSNADFGFPARVFVGTIGFLATWWVGAIAGWILGRASLRGDGLCLPFSKMGDSFFLVLLATFLGGVIGAIMNEFSYELLLPIWETWRSSHSVQDLKAFAQVGQIHNFGYLGALVGLLVAAVGLRRQLRKLAREEDESLTITT